MGAMEVAGGREAEKAVGEREPEEEEERQEAAQPEILMK